MSERLEYLLFRRAYLEAGMFAGQQKGAEDLNLYDLELRELNREIHILTSPSRKKRIPADWLRATAVAILSIAIVLAALHC